MAVQIEENGKSLKEKAPAESFYTEDEAFSAARIHFFLPLIRHDPNQKSKITAIEIFHDLELQLVVKTMF